MKLLYRLVITVSIVLTLVIALWAAIFYMAMNDEINDEVDDALEAFSEQIISKKLMGETLPENNQGSNNEYFIKAITNDYLLNNKHIEYKDTSIYIPSRKETEPARMLKSIFCDDNGNYFILTVLTPTFEKNDLKEAILIWVVILYSLLLLCLIGIFSIILYYSTKPLKRLLRWIEGYQVGNPNNKPLDNPTNITEFKKLNEAVTNYRRRAEDLFEQQKHFIGNASHEMQTPVAIAKNRLEMLLDDDELNENQQTEIAKVLQTLDYIGRLNRSLLLLTKIENGQYTDRKTMNINQLANKYLESFREIYAYKNLSIKLSEHDQFNCFMSEQLSNILITNILKNAFVHNHPEGSIRLEIYKRHIICCNSGGNGPLDTSRIFDRFYRGAKKENTSGLGLPIIDSICRLEQLRMAYSYANDEHCFKISG